MSRAHPSFVPEPAGPVVIRFRFGPYCGLHCGTVPPENRRAPLRHCPTCHQLGRIAARRAVVS